MSDDTPAPKETNKNKAVPKGTLTAKHYRDGKLIGEYVVSAELIKKEE